MTKVCQHYAHTLGNLKFHFHYELNLTSYLHNEHAYNVKVSCVIAQLLRFAFALCGIVLES